MLKKACLPLLNQDEQLYALQHGDITMWDYAQYQLCDNPYEWFFKCLPFNEAIDWSIRFAQDKINKQLEVKTRFLRWLDCVDDGFIPFEIEPSYKDDFTIAMSYALQSYLPENIIYVDKGHA